MANNYTQFAIALKVKDAQTVDSVIQFLDSVEEYDFQTDEDREVIRPDCFNEKDVTDVYEYVDNYGGVGGWENANNELYVYAEETANIDLVAFVLQKLLIVDAVEGNYKNGITITWANTCSKMRPDEFSGGACYITKDDIHWQPDVISWIDGLLNFK